MFWNKATVDTVLSAFNRVVADLEGIERRAKEDCLVIAVRLQELQSRTHELNNEASRAATIGAKIKALLTA